MKDYFSIVRRMKRAIERRGRARERQQLINETFFSRDYNNDIKRV